MSLHPSAATSVYEGEGTPFRVVPKRRFHDESRAVGGGGGGGLGALEDERRQGSLLPPRAPGDLLPSPGQGGLLRDGSRGSVRVQHLAELAGPVPGSPALAESLWADLGGPLRAFVRRRVANAADADDIVQSVFLRLHRSLGAIRQVERLPAWLFQAARRAVIDYYRAAERREQPAGDRHELAGHLVATEDGENEGRHPVEPCLATSMQSLSSADRQALVLSHLQGLPIADAAAVSGLSLAGMKSRLQRARKRLLASMLECCQIPRDARGRPLGCEPRGLRSTPCGLGREPEAA